MLHGLEIPLSLQLLSHIDDLFDIVDVIEVVGYHTDVVDHLTVITLDGVHHLDAEYGM